MRKAEIEMKKIWAVATVKNEKDIIESFCRYTLQICDGLLIRDDNSADNTKEIINQLIKEGLQIVLCEKPASGGSEFSQYQSVLNTFIRQAFEEYGADWVLPLDADEFPFCPDFSNPRDELEKLDESVEYRLYTRTYILEKPVTQNTVFLPYQFQTFLRYPKEKQMTKTLLSRKLYLEYNAQLPAGHHHLVYNCETLPEIVFWDRLFVAHFPFRSAGQMLAKVILGELNYKASFDRKNQGLHWNLMYNSIKESQAVDDGLIRRFSLMYSGIFETGADSQEPVLTEPFRTDFLNEPVYLKYTNLESCNYEYRNTVLTGMESIISNLKAEIEIAGTGPANAAIRPQVLKNPASLK